MKLKITFSIVLLGALFLMRSTVIAEKGKKTLGSVKDTCDSAGVYLTHDDYQKRKLTMVINPNRPGNKIGLNMGKNTLKITKRIGKKDSSATFKPGSIYGYYQCGEKFRYFKKSFYTITEKAPMVIYTYTVNNFSGLTEVQYFYSLTPESEVQSLTMKNIEKDFKSKPAFIREVKNRFTWVSGLAAMDENGKLLINELYGDYKYRND